MKNSSGAWWTKSWTPVVGCDMSLPCADRCWARGQAHMHARHPNRKIAAKYAGITDEAGRWTGQVRLWEPELDAPLHWRGPQVVAMNLMGDLWHEALDWRYTARIYGIMAACPDHIFVVLTKRPEQRAHFMGISQPASHDFKVLAQHEALLCNGAAELCWPLPNVECISASTQAELEERWGWLARTPAAKTGLHLEPLIAPVDVSVAVGHFGHYDDPFASGKRTPSGKLLFTCQICGRETPGAEKRCGGGVDWVVVGGETGPGARPMHLDWVRAIRDQCQVAGVPFWFKGWGEWAPAQRLWDASADHGDVGLFEGEPCRIQQSRGRNERDLGHCLARPLPAHRVHRFPDGMVMIRRKSAARLLDEREHSEVPW